MKLFLNIGAQKSGTSSIYEIFRQHPEINLAKIKETSFFHNDDLFSKGKEYYLNTYFLPQDDMPLLDVDPELLYNPLAAYRVAQTFGSNVYCFVILRDPATRAFSHFNMETYRGYEKLSFQEAIQNERSRISELKLKYTFSYLDRGFYARQLKNIFMHIDSKRVKVYLFEKDFLENRNKCIESICDFLGVSFSETMNTDIWSNPNRRIKSQLVDKLTRKNKLFTVFTSRIMNEEKGRKLRHKILKQNAITKGMKTLDNSERLRINHQYFKEDILELSELIGRDLSYWLN